MGRRGREQPWGWRPWQPAPLRAWGPAWDWAQSMASAPLCSICTGVTQVPFLERILCPWDPNQKTSDLASISQERPAAVRGLCLGTVSLGDCSSLTSSLCTSSFLPHPTPRRKEIKPEKCSVSSVWETSTSPDSWVPECKGKGKPVRVPSQGWQGPGASGFRVRGPESPGTRLSHCFPGPSSLLRSLFKCCGDSVP